MHVPVIVKLDCNIEGIQYCFEDVTNALLEKEGSNLKEVKEENSSLIIQIESTQNFSKEYINGVSKILKRFNIRISHIEITEDGRKERINHYR